MPNPASPGEDEATSVYGAFAALDRIGECLGWSPLVSIDEGIRLTWRDLVAGGEAISQPEAVDSEEDDDG